MFLIFSGTGRLHDEQNLLNRAKIAEVYSFEVFPKTNDEAGSH